MKLIHLNFLYVYRCCEELQQELAIYSSKSIDDITSEDIVDVVNYILYLSNVSVSREKFIYPNKIQELIPMSSSQLLRKVGVDGQEYVGSLKSFANQVNSLCADVCHRNFIDSFKKILSLIPYVLEVIDKLENIDVCRDLNNDNTDILNVLVF